MDHAVTQRCCRCHPAYAWLPPSQLGNSLGAAAGQLSSCHDSSSTHCCRRCCCIAVAATPAARGTSAAACLRGPLHLTTRPPPPRTPSAAGASSSSSSSVEGCVVGGVGLQRRTDAASTRLPCSSATAPHLLDMQLLERVLLERPLQLGSKLAGGHEPQVRSAARRSAAALCSGERPPRARTSGNASASWDRQLAGVSLYLPSACSEPSSSALAAVSSHSCCCSTASCLQNCRCWL